MPRATLRNRLLAITHACALCTFCAFVHPPAALAADPPAADDAPRARELYQQGIEHVRSARWGEALDAFERSSAIRPHPVTSFNIGACERALGRYVRAKLSLERALAESGGAAGQLPPSLSEDARAFLGEIDRALTHTDVTLAPADAGIAVDGRPLAALTREGTRTVLVGGVAAPGPGTAPPTATFELVLDPGAHVIALTRKGYSDAVVRTELAPGGRTRLDLVLERLPATIRIASNVPGAIVAVDSIDVGPAPVDVRRPAGSYGVVVRKSGFDSYVTNVHVNAGEEVELRAQLAPTSIPITSRWWFWASAGVALGGAALVTYGVTRPDPEPPPYQGGTTGFVATPGR